VGCRASKLATDRVSRITYLLFAFWNGAKIGNMTAKTTTTRSLYLLQELRREGKLPPPGALASPLTPPIEDEPCLLLKHTGATIPQLAYGLYLIPDSLEGETAIVDALAAGYRHFDSASFYGNEAMLGRALGRSTIPRHELFITSKVWNDAVKQGRAAVRGSVEKSLKDIGTDYFDLFLVHWPVPGYFVDAYKELEVMQAEGKLRAIGISNFNQQEYEELARAVSVTPAVNQIEVSPFMYRKEDVDYFQKNGIVVVAHKALNRAGAFSRKEIVDLADKHSVTAAQIMIRWGLQKGLVVTSKTVSRTRMSENRSVASFELDSEDMALLDSLTTEEDLQRAQEEEFTTKTSL
jgi:diketogulonate reductase-like aldo/keto reductase